MRLWTGSIAWLLVAMVGRAGLAQEGTPAAPAASRLAMGSMVTIEPDLNVSETVSRHDVVEILATDAKYDWAKDAEFRRDIWGLQFRFKPLRYVWVDFPQATGVMQRKLVRYMVYSVHNPGKAMHPVAEENGTFKVERVDMPIRFIPKFVLDIPKLDKSYTESSLPLAVRLIRQREDSSVQLLSSEEISGRELAVGATLWGVATWEDVDPRMDHFSVYVEGLTNAYQWTDAEGAYKVGAPLGTGRRLARKMLKLNFWRPGDEYFEHEDEIRYPAPGQVDYEWVYR
jgi:hypothetical protein